MYYRCVVYLCTHHILWARGLVGFGRTNSYTRWLSKPLSPRNQCTSWFAPADWWCPHKLVHYNSEERSEVYCSMWRFVLRQLDSGKKKSETRISQVVSNWNEFVLNLVAPFIHNGCVYANATNPKPVHVMLWLGICGVYVNSSIERVKNIVTSL